MEPSPATPPTGPVGAPSPAFALCPSTAAAAQGPASPSVAPTTSGPLGRRPTVPIHPAVPPGKRLSCDSNGPEWRKPPHPAGAVAMAGPGAEAPTSPAPVIAACLVPVPGGGLASVPEERPPLLGQTALAFPPRPAPLAVRAWLSPLGPPGATADWPLVRDVFLPAHSQDTAGAHAVWR